MVLSRERIKGTKKTYREILGVRCQGVSRVQYRRIDGPQSTLPTRGGGRHAVCETLKWMISYYASWLKEPLESAVLLLAYYLMISK